MKRIWLYLAASSLFATTVNAQDIFFEAHNIHTNNTTHQVTFDLYISGSAAYIANQSSNANNGLQNVDVAYDMDLGTDGSTGPITPSGVSITPTSSVLNAATATTSLGGASPTGYDTKFKVNLTRNVATSAPITATPVNVATITINFASSVVIGTIANGATLKLRTVTGGTGSKWSDFLGNTGQAVGASAVNPTPLPIVIRSFTTVSDHCDALLTWETASEDNAETIWVDQSQDGALFTAIGVITPKGKASQYTYPVTGGAGRYYRIRVGGKDGRQVQSAVCRTAAGDCAQQVLRITPNPIVTQVKIFVTTAEDINGVRAYVTDAAGRTVYSTKADLHKGENAIWIDMSGYAAGTYCVHVTGNGMEESAKLVKVN
jgi:hypothetical protein